ncbi:hypothetical protein ACFQ9V_10045 [Leifsonia sp. NPDC056665]|uniref:hypothetical protein n=1 Tax=Leifsonia sp. NPDC056665 TaxID=3345901 RepID=UPI00367405B7
MRTGPVACADLARPESVAALVGGEGTLQPLAHLQPGFSPAGSPFGVVNANGTVCGWGGMGVLTIDHQGDPQVFLEIVPGLGAEWAALASASAPSAGSHYDGGVSLGGSCRSGYCSTNVLVRGAWLSVRAVAVGTASFTEQAFHDFVQGVVTRYLAVPAPTPVATHALRACTDPRLAQALTGTFGSAAPMDGGRPVFDLDLALSGAGLSTSCNFDDPQNIRRLSGTVAVLADVDPAVFAQYRQAVDHPGATPIDVSGVPGTATGLIEPTEDSTRIVVDVLDGRTWLQVSTYQTDDTAAVRLFAAKLIASGWIG